MVSMSKQPPATAGHARQVEGIRAIYLYVKLIKKRICL
jgi:hypothetical protein